MSLFTGGGAVDLGISKPSLPSFTAPLIGLLDCTTSDEGGAFTVFGGVSSLSSPLRSSSAGREESQDRSLFSLVGDRHSSGGKVTCGVEM